MNKTRLETAVHNEGLAEPETTSAAGPCTTCSMRG
jgi:hypothetical protein